ncbi:MAG: hypothetical protein ACOYJ6_03315 [Caulobacterales bacterium]|jgi:hypothetical protein
MIDLDEINHIIKPRTATLASAGIERRAIEQGGGKAAGDLIAGGRARGLTKTPQPQRRRPRNTARHIPLQL